ncbi:sigma-70 family RNA polymerase sigma factor, partial [Streptomyces galilaeus]|uniref:sigma-70 family RNA polymerase sigma factor n=1 Tax=Streptomyces galilaeus TaxID=33899 RepID=UPI0038F7492E
LEHSEMNAMIMEKVEELPPKCRAIFKASLYEGKSYREIAEEQHINVATVRVQMKIALTKLRESLGTPYMIAILMFL